MILVGVDGCELCGLVQSKLPNCNYIKLNNKSESNVETIIKKRLLLLNKSKKFPVGFSDDLKQFYPTEKVLNMANIQHVLDIRMNK